MSEHPLQPRIVHPLPPAPAFVGREPALRELESWWHEEKGGVLALSAIGGSGKTALTAEFLKRLSEGRMGPSYEGLFVWSFYESPAPDLFLAELHDYVCGASFLETARGIALVFPVTRKLRESGRILLVLDGLEKLQMDRGAGEKFGHIPDGSLALLLRHLAAGESPARAILTSRYPLSDFQEWNLPAARQMDLNQVDPETARAILQGHGVNGTADVLDNLSSLHGYHALTADHLGGYLSRRYGGDPSKASSLPVLSEELTRALGSRDPQSLLLSRILTAVEDELPAPDRELLRRIAIFRTPVGESFIQTIVQRLDQPDIAEIPSESNNALQNSLENLAHAHLVIVLEESGKRRYALHPAVRDHFLARLGTASRPVHSTVSQCLATLVEAPDNVRLDEETLRALGEVFYHSVRAGAFQEAGEVLLKMGGFRELIYERGLLEFTEGLLRESFDFNEGLDGATLPPGLVADCFMDWISARMILGRLAPGESIWAHAGLRPYLAELRGDEPVSLNREFGAAWSMLTMRSYAFCNPESFLKTIPQVKEADDAARLDLVVAETFYRLNIKQEEADRRLRSAVRRAKRTGERDLFVYGFVVQAVRGLALKELRELEAILGSGLEAAREGHFRVFEADLLVLRSEFYKRRDQRDVAERDAQSALELSRKISWSPAEIRALRLLAELSRDPFEKVALRKEAEKLFEGYRQRHPEIRRYEEDEYLDFTSENTT